MKILWLFVILSLFGAMTSQSVLAVPPPQYVCPMQCEGSKRYSKEGTCPVCHMYLSKEAEPGQGSGSLNLKDYRVDLSSKPISKTEIEITLIPKHTKDDSVVKDIDDAGGVELEVYFTDQALTRMEYFIPQKKKDGRYVFKKTITKPENALLFAIFRPSGVQEQIFPLALKLEIPKAIPKIPSTDSKPDPLPISKTFDGHGYLLIISEDTTYFSRHHSKADRLVTGKKSLINETKPNLPKSGSYTAFIQTGPNTKISIVKFRN